jgi:hypothetical protein
MKRLSWPALIALVALAPQREARSQPGPRPVVIRGCSVLDVAGGRMIASRTVVLDGGKIQAVAAPGDHVETPAGATTIAAEGRFLIPGLIDAHVHLVHVLGSCRVTGDEVLPLFVAAGVTSVRDVGDEIVAETLVARFAEAFPEKAPRVFRSSPLIDREPPFHRDIGFALTDAAAVPGFVDEMAGWGVTTLKIYVGTPREISRVVLAEGHRRGLRVTGHLGAYTAQDAVADGIDALEHIWSVFNFIIPPEEAKRPDHRSTLDLDNPRAKALVAALAERRTFVDSTLVVFRNMILLNDQAAYSGHPDNAARQRGRAGAAAPPLGVLQNPLEPAARDARGPPRRVREIPAADRDPPARGRAAARRHRRSRAICPPGLLDAPGAGAARRVRPLAGRGAAVCDAP